MKFHHNLLMLSLAQLPLTQIHAEVASDFNNIFFFGDSLSDTGFFTNYDSQFGKFTTNPDKIWSEVLAESYGLKAVANSNNHDGNNYSAGGATVSTEVENYGIENVPSAQTQVNNYLNTHSVDPNTLYTIWIGSNDFLNPSRTEQTLQAAAIKEAEIVQQLSDAGANYILVPNLADLSLTPYASILPTIGDVTLTNTYNETLYHTLDNGTANVIPLNSFALMQEVVTSYEDFGFTNASMPACGTTDSIYCQKDSLPVNGDNYVFADVVHPTGATHQISAQYARSTLDAPSQFAQVSNAAVQAGFSRDTQINRRLNLLNKGEKSVWAEGEVTQTNDNDIDSNADLGNTIIGAGIPLTDNSQTGLYIQHNSNDYQTDSTYSRSSVDMRETGFGLYHIHALGNYQLSTHMGIDNFHFDWKRHISLGALTRTHKADGKGSRKQLSLQLGRQFDTGEIKYMPYVSALYQKVSVNKLTENNANLSTSMRFEDYDQDSLLLSLGIKLNAPLTDKLEFTGDVHYSYDAKHNDEATVTANLRSVDSDYSRGFYLPVETVNEHIFSVSAGLNAKLTSNVNVQAGVSLQGNNDSYETTGYLGITTNF